MFCKTISENHGDKIQGDTGHKRSSPPLFYCLAGQCERSFTRT